VTVAQERLATVDAAMLFDVLLPALRGHFGIRSSDLVDLARERGLTVPPGEAAARPAEWQALLERLAGVEPLAAGEEPVRLLDIVRDLTDLVEGSVAPTSWWQRLLGGGGRQPARDERAGRLLELCGKLSDGIALPPELVRPLIGRFSGALTHDETAELAGRLEDYGRDGWVALGADGVHAEAWAPAYDRLVEGARAAAGRGRGLLYDSGY
jgi:hypothetical protein